MPIFEQLKNDHDKLRSLLAKIENAGPRATAKKSELLSHLSEWLLLHSKAEEMFFYQAILRGEYGSDLTCDEALESLEDHLAIENALAEIEDTDPLSPAWRERFLFFKRSLERHFLVEEKVLFKKARGLVSREVAGELGAAFLDWKSQANAKGVRA